VAAAALRNYKASATGIDGLVKQIASLGARAGLMSLMPGKMKLVRSNLSIDTYIGQMLQTEVRLALYIGPPRAVQKPVLQVLNLGGETIAFAKVAANALTQTLIRNETEAIRRIQAQRFEHIRTPQVLLHSTWRGADVIVQSPIAPGGSMRVTRQLLPQATLELARGFGSTWEPWSSSQYRGRLRAKVEEVSPRGDTALIRDALARLDEFAGDMPLEFGAWHGDWAPWNMTTHGGTIVAWDWEHFERGVPVGFDPVHYDVAQLLSNGATPVEAFDAVLNRRSVGELVERTCDQEAVPVLVAAYVLEIATRYIHDGEDLVGGTAMSRLESWLPKVLSKCWVSLAGLERD